MGLVVQLREAIQGANPAEALDNALVRQSLRRLESSVPGQPWHREDRCRSEGEAKVSERLEKAKAALSSAKQAHGYQMRNELISIAAAQAAIATAEALEKIERRSRPSEFLVY